MLQEEMESFSKVMRIFGLVYEKDFGEDEINVYWELLKELEFTTVKQTLTACFQQFGSRFPGVWGILACVKEQKAFEKGTCHQENSP